MVNHASGSPLPERHVERLEHQLGAQVTTAPRSQRHSSATTLICLRESRRGPRMPAWRRRLQAGFQSARGVSATASHRLLGRGCLRERKPRKAAGTPPAGVKIVKVGLHFVGGARYASQPRRVAKKAGPGSCLGLCVKPKSPDSDKICSLRAAIVSCISGTLSVCSSISS